MMILHDTARVLTLGACDWENNPFVLWNNKATISNISSVTGVASDGAASNAVTGTTYDYALPLVSVVDSASLNVTAVTAPLTMAAIAAHNLGTLGVDVAVQYSTDGGTVWHDCGAGVASPTDDGAIVWRFEERIAADWRLIITNVTEGQPAIGVMVLGKETILPMRLYQGYRPPLTQTNVALQSNVSEGGHLLGSRVMRQGSTIKAEIDYLADSFVRSHEWLAFQRHFNEGNGFFWAWRPAKYDDVFYAWRSGNVIAPPNSGPQARMSVAFEARCYHDG